MKHIQLFQWPQLYCHRTQRCCCFSVLSTQGALAAVLQSLPGAPSFVVATTNAGHGEASYMMHVLSSQAATLTSSAGHTVPVTGMANYSCIRMHGCVPRYSPGPAVCTECHWGHCQWILCQRTSMCGVSLLVWQLHSCAGLKICFASLC